ncbi:Gfo/Idh/MocA family oxidoreductase [Thalassoglobus sp.]|uniref:Gfo/Idh/MocA family oxidoreductase n=1 Tax=Thalassoglobus sp. TaxID=2795869 RepID=UPI003AA997DA
MSETSRRDFMKTTSVAAVGAGLLSSVANRAYAAGDEVIRIGLVGCGGRGTGAASQALQSPGNVELVAMGDAFQDQMERSLTNIEKAVKKDESAHIQVAQENMFVGFDAYKKVIDSGIDLVILATPPGFRPMMFGYAVEKGVHVFMEKPVATDAAGVRKVLEAAKVAKEKKLKVGVGLQRHHQACYQEFIQRVHDGQIGDVRALRVYWNGGGVWDPRKTRDEVKTEMEYQMRNWYYYNWLCGDHINEQHIHNLDVGNWIMQQYPVSAVGMGGREVRTDKKYGEIFDHHAVQFTYEDGTVMFSECRHIRNCWNSVTEHAHGTNGLMDLSSNPRNCKLTWAQSGNVERFKGDTSNPYQVEHDRLFAAIRKDEEYSEAEYGAMSTMTAILGRMSTYSGKEITMEKALTEGPQIVPNPEDLSWDLMPPAKPDEDGVYPVPVPGVTDVFAS